MVVHRLAQAARAAFDRYRLMHQLVAKISESAVEKAQLELRVTAAFSHDLIPQQRGDRNVVAAAVLRAGQRGKNFVLQSGGDFLIGIDRQDPIVRGLAYGPGFLLAVAAEIALQYLAAKGFAYFDGAIRAAGIHDQYFIAPCERRQRPGDVQFFVKRNDDRANFLQYRPLACMSRKRTPTSAQSVGKIVHQAGIQKCSF